MVDESIAHFGHLDVLVNNAGLSTEGALVKQEPAVYQTLMNVNVLGSIYMAQAALPHIRKTKGSILFIGSVAGIRGLPGYSAYSASKMAVTAVAESLQTEETPFGVHVGITYVGFTENDENKTILDTQGKVVPQPDRSFVKQMPVRETAACIRKQIEERRFRQVLTPLGKALFVVNRVLPGLARMILARNYFKQ